MRERTFRDFGRAWVWLLIAGPLSAGCAKSRSEGAAPSVTPAAAPSAAAQQAAPQAAPAAPQGAAGPAPTLGAPAPTTAASAASRAHKLPSSESRREEHHAAPSTLKENQRYGGEPLNTIAEAQAALERANRQLVALYAPASGKGKAAATATDQLSQSQRCDIACKAFASLERAADAVCRLAGERDARCKHARHLVDVNRQRVASCNCPSS